LATLLGVLSHPARLRIVEDLQGTERDVSSLSEVLELAPSSTSQHLALLRAHGIVQERREGRRVLYRLEDPQLAHWLTEGFRFLVPSADAIQLKKAVARARDHWGGEENATAASRPPKTSSILNKGVVRRPRTKSAP
jgi:DNA-binding transcriptional ArsR family regulator